MYKNIQEQLGSCLTIPIGVYTIFIKFPKRMKISRKNTDELPTINYLDAFCQLTDISYQLPKVSDGYLNLIEINQFIGQVDNSHFQRKN